MSDIEISFVVAQPDWEVLYYVPGGTFKTAAIVAWGIYPGENNTLCVFPITSDLSWGPDDNRAICTPDGDVTYGEVEKWPTVWAWLDDMARREVEGTLPTEPAAPQQLGPNTVVLDTYRRRFQQPESS